MSQSTLKTAVFAHLAGRALYIYMVMVRRTVRRCDFVVDDLRDINDLRMPLQNVAIPPLECRTRTGPVCNCGGKFVKTSNQRMNIIPDIVRRVGSRDEDEKCNF